MTYARARLWLGISGVGLMVVLSILALLLHWPKAVFAGFNPGLASDVWGLLWIIALYAAIHIPLDYIGGYWLPCHFSRQCLMFSFFASQYLRGMLIQCGFLLVSGLVVLQVGRWGGRLSVLALLFIVMLLMVEGQDLLARIVAGLQVSSSENIQGKQIVMLSGMDAGFAGGMAGLPGRERFIVPSLWQRILPKGVLDLEIQRRTAALETGSRIRGLVLALVWNLGGFYLSSLAPNAVVTTLSVLFTTSLWFTLWSFIGLLLLPSFSRRGVFELDQFARIKGMKEPDFALAVRELDQLQDDEPKRPTGIETIFHPVPCVESRIEKFREGKSTAGAWNAARYALYLSWPCFGYLNRAVHCNSGRPELWVMLPVD
jgi:hypothetical protein